MILHGLFGMGRNWAGIAKALSKTHRVLTVDLRNHGASPWDDAMDYRLMADDVAKLIEAQFNGAVAVIGHSMGGKVAMTLGCEWPNLVERLCVVDIAPATYNHDFGSHLDTMASMDTRALARRTDAESIIANAVDNRHIAQFLSRNLKPADDGHGFVWQINVAAIAANMDNIVGFPVLQTNQACLAPALFLLGGESNYVQPFHIIEIERLFPNATIEVISSAGHWVHADKPAEVTTALHAFLNN